MALIFFLSSRSTLPHAPGLSGALTAIGGHLVAYAVLALLLAWGLGGGDLTGRQRLLLAFTIAVAYGVTDEFHQSFVPGRDANPVDLLLDAVGAATALLMMRWLAARRTGNATRSPRRPLGGR
jgi:VanZ family protein